MAAALSTNTGTSLASLSSRVYDACNSQAEEDDRAVFTQRFIFELDIIPDNNIHTLLAVTQRLCDDKLFIPVNAEGSAAWRLRSKEEAKKYHGLSFEEDLVYTHIDEAGAEGIWLKTIKTRTQLHDKLVTDAIKHLEAKTLITKIQHAEYQHKKIYIKASLRPSERATGGPWFTDGEVDTEFIETMANVLHKYIENRTYYRSHSVVRAAREKQPLRTKRPSAEEIKALQEKGLGPIVKQEEHSSLESPAAANDRRRRYDAYLPMPAGYANYPTLDEMTRHLEANKFTDTTLAADEVQQLLNILVYDKRIEKVVAGQDDVAYRALRTSLKPNPEDPMEPTVLAQVPCGRCPVFDLCEEGGPVGPSNCEYFQAWLDM